MAVGGGEVAAGKDVRGGEGARGLDAVGEEDRVRGRDEDDGGAGGGWRRGFGGGDPVFEAAAGVLGHVGGSRDRVVGREGAVEVARFGAGNGGDFGDWRSRSVSEGVGCYCCRSASE